MKKFLVALAAVFALGCGAASAQLGVFNHLGVDASVSTMGIGVEVATPITDFVNLRVGADFMPGIKFHANANVNLNTPVPQKANARIDASLARTQGHFLFNVYPLGKLVPVYAAVGGYFGGQDVVKLDGNVENWASLSSQAAQADIQIGDYFIPVDANGYAHGGIQAKKFRPYVGIGYGRPVPGKLLSFMVDLGVQFHGHMNVWYDKNGERADLVKDLNLNSNDKWQKVMNKVTVYPVLKFTLAGKIF